MCLIFLYEVITPPYDIGGIRVTFAPLTEVSRHSILVIKLASYNSGFFLSKSFYFFCHNCIF
nr:MAG TPA: hypothetical protein [Caudoviricetes sp.]